MIKKIFYIHSFPFSKGAYIKDEFEYFTGAGYDVKFLDIADFIKRKKFERNYNALLQKSVVAFDSRQVFSDFLLANRADSIIVTDVGLLSKTAWMYRAIFKAKIPYMLFENPTLAHINTVKTTSVKVRGFVKLFKRIGPAKIFTKLWDVYNYVHVQGIKYSPQRILTSKERLSAEKRALRFDNTLVCSVSSSDYATAISSPELSDVEEPYAVFVDQYFIHHPDFVSKHIVHSFTADEYYPQLNTYLQEFSEKNKLKVVVAAHPRRSVDKRSDFLPQFDLRYNQTASLVRTAEVVLMHFSTAVNFAVIFNKPFVLLDSPLFLKSNIKTEIDMLANGFGQEVVDMSETGSITPLDQLKVNEGVYNDFFSKYIKRPEADDKTLRDHVQDVLQNLS